MSRSKAGSELQQVIGRLYWYHAFNNIALSVVTNFLFLDKLFLRMGLDFTGLGIIKGVGFMVPMALNLLISPWIQQLNKDRQVVSLCFFIRVFLPLGLLKIPSLEIQGTPLIVLITGIMVFIHMFPIVAGNCLQSIIRTTIPEQSLGKHLTWINVVWTLPGYMLAIPLSRYVDTFQHAPDSEFYHALGLVMFGTAAFQAIASPLMLTMPKPPERVRHDSTARALLKRISVPFHDVNFRPLLLVVLVFQMVASMIASFINPYLMLVQGLPMGVISTLSAGVSILSIVIMPMWGRSLDTLGGHSSYRIALVGFIVCLAALLGGGWIVVIVFALGSWEGQRGAFGSGLAISQQYLIMMRSDTSLRSVYYAAATSMIGLGWFVGANAGGIALDMLQSHAGLSLSDAYKVMFMVAIAISLSLVPLVRKLGEDKTQLPGALLWRHLLRSALGLFEHRRK